MPTSYIIRSSHSSHINSWEIALLLVYSVGSLYRWKTLSHLRFNPGGIEEIRTLIDRRFGEALVYFSGRSWWISVSTFELASALLNSFPWLLEVRRIVLPADRWDGLLNLAEWRWSCWLNRMQTQSTDPGFAVGIVVSVLLAYWQRIERVDPWGQWLSLGMREIDSCEWQVLVHHNRPESFVLVYP